MFHKIARLLVSILCGGWLVAAACGGDDGRARGWNAGAMAIEDAWITDVHADRFGDVWAVGGQPGRGVAARYDGRGWMEVLFPEQIPLLRTVQSFPNGATVVAGDGGTILRWNGEAWNRANPPTDADLHSIWGPAPDDLWAVGGSNDDASQGVILRYRGSQWNTVDWPRSDASDVHMFHAVWGTGSDELFVAGDAGTLLHWEGDSFQLQEVDTDEPLKGLGGVESGRVVAVGGDAQGIVVWRSEAGWTRTSLNGYSGGTDVWMERRNRGWIIGRRGLVARLQFDGDTLTFQPTSVPTSMTLSSISGAGGPGLFAVGGTFEQSQGPFEGILLRRSTDID